MEDNDEINMAAVLDAIYFERKLVVACVALFMLIGGLYALFAPPVYKGDMLIQIEDSTSNSMSKSLLGDVSNLFESKTEASAEMEILRSRTLASYTVSRQHLDFYVTPHYFPLFGAWFARRADSLSNDTSRPWSGFAWGGEQIEVNGFKVPPSVEDEQLTLLAEGPANYRLLVPSLGLDVTGQVGRVETWKTPMGEVELDVAALRARSGTEFYLTHFSHQKTVEDLQKKLVISEKGKQSGILSIELEWRDPVLVAGILNTLGSRYLQQNTERKSAEAQKSLEFLARVLPEAKKNLERAEERFVTVRNEHGTVDLAEETKQILQRMVELLGKEAELKMKRDELLQDLTATHPAVQVIDTQLTSLRKEISKTEQQIKRLPNVERQVLGLTRDVKLNSDVLTNLMNSEQEMQLVKASKVGSASVVDYAVVPESPVKPYRGVIFLLSVFAGVLLGVIAAVIKRAMRGGVEDAHEIERVAGAPVFATVPVSEKQTALSEKIMARARENLLLAHLDTYDPAIESLRNFRTSLQFAMLEAKNNIVMISGTAQGVGKSFAASNLAGVMAEAGKRVLLIDLDLRKGHLNQYFGLPRDNGWAELIAGVSDLSQVLRKNLIPNLDFIATGALAANPNDILLNPQLPVWLEKCAVGYDIVILDLPPILAVSDASIIAPHAGTLILTVREGKTSLAEIRESVKRFNQAGVGVTGVLMNGVRARPFGYYRYGTYNYRYSGHAYESYRPKSGRQSEGWTSF